MSTYLPKPYTDFLDAYPEVGEAYRLLAERCHEAGPLDAKTRHLIKLGIGIAMQSKGAIRAHARQALEAGATEAEIRHAVLLSLTTNGYPAMIYATKQVDEVLAARG